MPRLHSDSYRVPLLEDLLEGLLADPGVDLVEDLLEHPGEGHREHPLSRGPSPAPTAVQSHPNPGVAARWAPAVRSPDEVLVRVGRPGGIEPAEAADLRAAGLLRRVLLDVHAPVDVPDTATLRAAAVACMLPRRLVDAGAVVALTGAAWILASGEAPSRLDVVLPPDRNLPGGRALRVHQMRLDRDDVTVRAAVRVTCPVRTLADLARDRSVPVAELRRVAAVTGCRPEEVLARLGRLSGHRGVVRARRVVSGWADGRRTGSVLVTAPHHPVGVEHAVHLADGGDDVAEVRRIGHLEGEP